MIVKFMDGPLAGTSRDLPIDRGYWATIQRPKVSCIPDNAEYQPPQITDYVIYQYLRPVFCNDHVDICDIAKLAYSGPPPEHSPGDDLPYSRRRVQESPVPDFLTDFDAWWRRKLWDFKVTQDRETRYELQRLEHTLERIKI